MVTTGSPPPPDTQSGARQTAPGPGPIPSYRYVLAALFADADLSVFEFNRCVAGVEEGAVALVERLRPTLTVRRPRSLRRPETGAARVASG